MLMLDPLQEQLIFNLNLNFSMKLSDVHNEEVLIPNRLPVYMAKITIPSSEAYLSARLTFLFQLGD